MQAIKNLLFTDWHPMRWLRLVLGIIIMVEAFRTQDTVIGILAGIVFMTALINLGCRGNSCAVPLSKKYREHNSGVSTDDTVNK